ncbi:hypothetical protein glysoja_029111 [Glycine soja]|uniref:Uncharacterized protein n=1 Tax=Glycine soja TaxID=3848 RepID=A0A0B2QCR8_GLYSO|nr:hypothetical protein glysoja_029111 [Glycine soja]
MSNSETNVAHPLNHCHKAHNKYQLQFTTSLCDRTTLVGTLSRNNLHEKAKAHEGATLSKRFGETEDGFASAPRIKAIEAKQ